MSTHEQGVHSHLTLRLTFLAVVLATVGCHEEVAITGQLTVPVEVQRLFSRERPGSLQVLSSQAGESFVRYLCEPEEQPLVLPYHLRHYGCAVEGKVEAFVFAVKPEFIERVRCGEPGSGSGGLRGEELASASTVVFAGRGGCESGETTANLTLTLK